MNASSAYPTVSALVFAIVGLAHLARAIAAWPLVIAGYDVPVLLSWPAGLGALALCAWGLSQRRA